MSMKFISFLKKLFQKKKHLQHTAQQSTPQQSVAQRHEPKFSSSREVARQIAKKARVQTIRERNIERRRSTLGYGLRGKFRPRPAFEKRQWKLDEKPDKEKD